MVVVPDSFDTWLADAGIPAGKLTPEQRGLLQAAFRFRHTCGDDYYSTRLLSHFLLHCDAGLTITQIARLLGLSRPTASRQRGLSSKQAIQQAHHRLDGRPYGKLLPRSAGPIAQFLLTHPEASRIDLLDFIDHTFHVRVSRTALFHFLKKYGLDQSLDQHAPTAPPRPATVPLPAAATDVPTTAASPRPAAPPLPVVAADLEDAPPPLVLPPPRLPELPPGRPLPSPAPPFSPHAPRTPAPSSCCPTR